MRFYFCSLRKGRSPSTGAGDGVATPPLTPASEVCSTTSTTNAGSCRSFALLLDLGCLAGCGRLRCVDLRPLEQEHSQQDLPPWQQKQQKQQKQQQMQQQQEPEPAQGSDEIKGRDKGSSNRSSSLGSSRVATSIAGFEVTGVALLPRGCVVHGLLGE